MINTELKKTIKRQRKVSLKLYYNFLEKYVISLKVGKLSGIILIQTSAAQNFIMLYIISVLLHEVFITTKFSNSILLVKKLKF